MKRRTLIYQLFAFLVIFSFMLSPLQIVGFISLSPSENSTELSLEDQEFLSSLQNVNPEDFFGESLTREEAALQGIQDYTERLSLKDETPEVNGDPKISEDLNLGNLLSDNEDDYRKIWEPWLTKAAVRTMVTSPDQQFLLVGGGYLYDNTIKVYRYNPVSDEYEHVWDSGDQIIQSDVVSLAWGDTNHNKFPEVIAGSADGHVYVFEQAHIYDPKTNTENRFEFAWKSPLIQQVWGVIVDDTDLDYIVDIVAGSWDGKIHWYEATDLGDVPVYPFAPDHSIDYREKFTATLPGNERITALASTDTDGDGLPEVIAGTWDGNVFIYENNGTVFIGEGGAKIPLPQTNSYRLDYENHEQFWNPITKISVGNLDNDPQKELAFLVPGQGVFTFDYDSDTEQYFFNKLTKPPESWELGTSAELDVESAGYPVNSYVDWMLTGENVLSRQNEADLTDPFQEEPFDDAFRDAYPYNTSMAFLPNNSYSYFGMYLDNHIPSLSPSILPIGNISSAIVDFGFAQEATGDGRFNDGTSLKGYDLLFYMDKNTPVRSNQWEISISADREIWSEVYLDETTTSSCSSYCIYYIDTDPALNRYKMLEYRYVNMTYHGDGFIQKVDSVKTTTLARPLTEATALKIGTVDFDYVKSLNSDDESDKVIVGSSDGKLFAYEYDESVGKVTQLWTSYNGISDLFTLGTNIWDIVQVQNEGKIPTWRARTDISNMTLSGSSIPGGYVSHTHAHLWGLDLLYDFIPRQNDDLIVTTKTGRTLFYPQSKSVYSQSLTDYYFFAVNQYFQGKGFELSHGFGDSNNDTYPELMVTGAWDKTIADPSTNTKANAGLYLWLSAGVSGGNFPTYLGPIDLVALEQTGMLERALENSRAQPSASFADLDKDGDLDIIFTNGKVYVLWNELAGFVYRLDAEYFSFVNDNTRGRLYTLPIAVDFDDDDDFDLVVSNTLTGNKPKYGGTYWINEGTPTLPKWREDKWLFVNSPPPTKDQDPPESNLNFHNYTNFQFIYDPDTGKVANMTSFGYKVNGIVGFQADYINHDHFIVATYPLLKRVEINLRNSTVYKNWGYRVFETWNTRQELKEWTQSITTGDLDGDGKGEVIVGDYDNNVYVFEYLTSGLNGSVNTYKRQFRSFDLTQNERLDETPYFAEELPGIAETDFNRTLWHHATFLITGVDLNKNGFQEIIVTAGLSIYVFEKTERVDTYRLMWMTDLRFSKFAKLFESSSEITALGGGYDMDFNERGEFMVAVGGILMMFEYAGNDNFVELYGGNPVTQSTNLCLSPCLFGRYANVGNEHFATKQSEYIWSNLVITSLVVDDVNNNSLQDIVIGGYFEQTWGREDGYLIILEHHLGTITPIYEMELKILREIPISDVIVADQDYDGLKELIIGHKKGVDVWEFDPTDLSKVSFVKLTHITSSMNHPIIPLNLVLVGYEGSVTDNFDLKIRDHDLLMVRYQHGVWLDPGDMVEVIVMGSYLVLIFSKNDGKTWFPVPGAVYLDSGVQHPTILQMNDGRIIIAYSDERLFTIADIKTAVVEWNVSGTSLYEFQSISTIRTDGGNQNTFTHPSLYQNPYHPGEVSITYIRENNTNKNIEIQNRVSDVNWGSVVGTVPNIGNADLNFTYSVSSQDVVYHSATGGFVLAFSGLKYSEFKPDRDIFILFANNDTLVSNFTSRVAFNSVDDLFPSISTLMDEQDHSIIIAYEERGIVPGGRIMVSHSETFGQTWNPPEPLPTQLKNVVNYCFEGLGCYQFLAIPSGGFGTGDQVNQETVYDQDIKAKKVDTNIQKFTYVWIAGIEAFSPAIVGRVDGGFAFTYAMNILYGDYKLFLQNVLQAFFQGLANGIQAVNLHVQQQNNNQNQAQLMALYTNEAQKSFVVTHSTVFGRVPVLVSGVNPSSVFAKFSNGETIALTEGDSDGDARKELLIASDRGLFLEELETSGIGLHTRQYVEIYTKIDYDHGLHDVAMYDTNGNGFEELIVAGEEGNVYSYEVVNVYQSTTDLHYLKHLWSNEKALGQPKEPGLRNLVETYDVNNDNKLDVIYSSVGMGNATVSVVDGATGLDLWTVNPSLDHGIFGPITSLRTDGDSLVLGFKTGQLLVLSLSDGSFRWSTPITGYPVTNSVYGNFIGPNIYSIAWVTSNEIVVRRTDGSDPYMIGEAFLDSFFDIFPISRSNTTGITDLGAITETGRVEIFHLNPWNITYYNQTYVNGSIYGGTALAYDLTGDGIDELFFAANGLLFAFDSYREMLWNSSDSSLDVELRDLRIIKTQRSNKNHVILTSKPAVIDFEDMIPEILDPNAIVPGGYDFLNNVSFYSDRGVNFSSTFLAINTSFLNLLNPVDYPASYYNASSGQIAAITIDTTDYLEFEEPQQYVSFKLDIFRDHPQNTWDLQIRGLDSSNKTVYASDIIGNVVDHDVFISLPSPMLKRIIFVGLDGISDKVLIDDLVVGGTSLSAFDVEDGEPLWRYELLPTEGLTVHDGMSTFFEENSQLLTLGYEIYPVWESFFDAHKGSIALDVSSGMPYYTANSPLHMHEAVSIGNAEFVVLFETSELASGGTITDKYYPEIKYQAQNDAIWQVNTNRFFKTIDKGQLDPDQAQEMVITDGHTLLVAMDNNGDFMWKYRAKAQIRDVVLADFILSGTTDQVAVLLGDGTIDLLDPTLGLQVSPNFPQYIQWYEILTGLSVDMNADGKQDLIIGSGKGGSPVAGRVNFLTYNIATRKFDHLYPQVNVAGHVRELLPVDFNGDGSANDLAVLGYGYRITGFNSDSTLRGFQNDKVLTMVVGDVIGGDSISEIYYANKDNETRYIDNTFGFTGLVESSPILPKYSRIESLAIFDYNQDSALDIAIHYRAFGTTIKDPVNGNEEFWEDPAIFATLSSVIDLDLDGYKDLLVTNDNLLYALGHSSPYLTSSPLPHWSTPLSTSRVVTSLPVDVTGNGVDELVFMNIKGEFFAVKPISNPLSLMRPLVTTNSVDTNNWEIIGYSDEFYEDVIPILELSEEIESQNQSSESVPLEYFLIFGIIGGIATSLVSIVAKDKKLFSKLLRKHRVDNILVGGDK